MRTFVTAAALAFATLGTPSASAVEPSYDCAFDATAQEQVTGSADTYRGVASGWVASDPTESVTIQCWIAVDGVRVAETPAGSGTGVATTHGEVTYTATDDSSVALCTDWSSGAESGSSCPACACDPFPPQELWDLLDAIPGLVEETLCALHAPLC